ncbi:MAG TPA: DUF6174 domain-containing protein [Terriglobia bacterium]|nr:DUF6174 domain-containing protein [Terriglobia bacterium]
MNLRVSFVLALCALSACSGMDTLTPSALDAAMKKWTAARIDSYRMIVDMEGDKVEKEQFEVVVRDGSVATLKRNGKDVAPGSSQDYSMIGLFRMLGQEMSLAEKPQVLGAPEGYSAYLMATFDDRTGRLERYRRTVGGASNTINIIVSSFEPLEEGKAP